MHGFNITWSLYGRNSSGGGGVFGGISGGDLDLGFWELSLSIPRFGGCFRGSYLLGLGLCLC